MSEELYHTITTRGCCSMDQLKGKTAPAPLDYNCKACLEEMAKEVGFFYAYNLYEACPSEVPSRAKLGARRMLAGGARPSRKPSAGQLLQAVGVPANGAVMAPLTPSAGAGDTGLGAPCLGSAMDVYFGLNATKDALGIPLSNNFIVLDNGIGFNYTTDSAFVGYVYQKAIAAGKRVLVYEGDSDACGLQTAPIEDICGCPSLAMAPPPPTIGHRQGRSAHRTRCRSACRRRSRGARGGWPQRGARCRAASPWRGWAGRCASRPSVARATWRRSTAQRQRTR